MAITRSLLLFLLLSFFASFAFAEIRFTEIRSDGRPIIPFDEFGFTHTGRLELNVSKIALSDPNPDLDLSKVGFFLCTRDAWLHVLQQIEDGEVSCPLTSDLVKPVYVFKSLNGKSNIDTIYEEKDADQFTLIFANCLNKVKVSMNVRSAMYNLDGERKTRDYLSASKTTLPRVYFPSMKNMKN